MIQCGQNSRLTNTIDLDTHQFGFRIKQTLAPLPRESRFLGASFTTIDGTRAQPSDQHRDTAKKPRTYEEKPKRSKRAECVELESHTITEVHNLQDDIDRLRLGSGNIISIDSQFRATLWAGVKWKMFLKAEPVTRGTIVLE